MGPELRCGAFSWYVHCPSQRLETYITGANSPIDVAHLQGLDTHYIDPFSFSFLRRKAFTKRLYGMNMFPLFQ